MTDGQLLLLLFALIYLSDTMVWVSLSGYAVSSRWRSDWRLRSPSPRFEGLGGGLVTLQPFPPLGTVFVTEGWPFSVTQEGISPVSPEGPVPGIPPAPPKGSQCWKWEEIERISVDRKRLLINGGSFARTSGETRARHLAALLRRLRSAGPTGREEAIHREVSRAFRSRDATRRVAALLKALRPLRINCCLLFVVSFLVLPPVYWWFGEGRPTWIALAMMWLLMVLCSVEYLLIHRRLYPGQVGERWQHFFLGLLLPHHGMRTLDALTRNFLVGYHPLAVAAALTGPEEFRRFAALRCRDARHPVPLGSDTAPRWAGEYLARHLRPALESLVISEAGPDALRGCLAPPEAESPRYCPRCHIAYGSTAEACPDCGGIPLRAHPDFSGKETAGEPPAP